jgi:hypothetical protein
MPFRIPLEFELFVLSAPAIDTVLEKKNWNTTEEDELIVDKFWLIFVNYIQN